MSTKWFVVPLVLLLFLTPLVSFANEGIVDTAASKLKGCSAFVAGKDATVDGYTMSGHTCDGNCDFQLKVIPAATHESGEMYFVDYEGLPGGFGHVPWIDGEEAIPQVPETYKYFSVECPFANEFQVFWGENTCCSREELREMTDEEALIDWTQTSMLALQRGKTARETIQILGALIEEYGLRGCGESYLISDPHEAWVMEIPGGTRQWVAARCPDDQVCVHANRMRICEIDLADPDNFMASPELIQLAVDKGFYDPEIDGPFCFEKVYNPPESPEPWTGRASWACRRREWRMLSLLAPSKKWDPNAIQYPLGVKPDEKISVQWWIDNVWRDHMEGTQFDLTQGLPAGPFGCPERPSIEDASFERPISYQWTAYSWVSQARADLPDPIGGVAWFAFDQPASNCYVPFYVGVTDTPKSWRAGDFTEFSENSARWWFQALDNYSCLRFNEMNADARAVFDSIEADEFALQPYIENIALELYDADPALCQDFLTKYSSRRALEAETAARDMFHLLLAKYADGDPITTVSEQWMQLLEPYAPGELP